jgi:hypothetical protein
MILRKMQSLLARLYDTAVEHDVEDFLVTDRDALRALLGEEPGDADEQVFVVEEAEGVRLGVFIDQAVLVRLRQRDPWERLDDANLSDYCTALEGVSHFHYLLWCLGAARNVSLLELELQAEVDKYVSAVSLMTDQGNGRFPSALHARMFDAIDFLPGLDAASRRRYEEASRHAARYCRALDERYLRARRLRPERWLAELRRFFRSGHPEKLRQLTVA